MSKKIVNIAPLQRRALMNIDSFNEETMEFECTYATDAPILVSGWDSSYYEILTAEGQRSERMAKGAPLLNNHDRYGNVEKNTLGIVTEVRAEGGNYICKIKLSARESIAGIRQDIKDGILRNFSAGYRVFKYEEVPMAEGETIPTYKAIDWEPFEVSLVPVPADTDAQTRSAEDSKNELIVINNREMAKEKPVVQEGATPEPIQERQAPGVDTADIAKKAVEAERKRALEIRAISKKANLPSDFAEKLINDGIEIDQARALVIDEFSKQDVKVQSEIKAGADSADKLRNAMVDGLSMRANVRIEAPAAGAEEFRGMSLIRMAQTFLESNGVGTRGLTNNQIAKKVISGTRGYHSTSDFPNILANVLNKTLRAAYDYQTRTFQPWTTREDFSDFKEKSVTQLSGLVGDFDEVSEGGEYKAGSLSDAAEKYAPKKYGKLIPITWEALINDDMGAFTRLPRAFAAKAANKQSDIMYAILTDNANMADGNALFSVAHGNLAGSGSAITVASLNAGRAAMRVQKGIEGDFINVMPEYLIVGPDKETEAQQVINATIVATKTTDTNPFRGTLQIIVDPRLTGNQWYLSANPMMVDTLQYGFLSGEPELATEEEMSFNVDALTLKARMVFGAKSIDWRGLYKNPGN